ncbi:hypothetical protein [Diplocloster hominis]|uniref:hypothetical protein n=1 Tax=Diplocloster hominis TaxID=3079010 RepID=UPI0031B9BFBD
MLDTRMGKTMIDSTVPISGIEIRIENLKTKGREGFTCHVIPCSLLDIAAIAQASFYCQQ